MKKWKSLSFIGYDDYLVSDHGDVESCIGKGKELKKRLYRGYYRVNLYKNKKMKSVRVHRLVALAFLENKDNKSEINHKDGDKKNNLVDNLEWCTRRENVLHAVNVLKVWPKNGFSKFNHCPMECVPRGEKHYKSKITEKIAQSIRNFCLYGFMSKDIAEKYNVSPELVSLIKNNKRW